MAIVAITSTGTGELLIRYTESSVQKSLRVLTPIAGLYLDNANTGFKYKIISGTPTAPTGTGITFTQITPSYRKLVWDYISYTCTFRVESDYYFTSLIVGNTTYNFEQNVSISVGDTIKNVSDQIYKLNNPNISPTSYKKETANVTKPTGLQASTLKSSLVVNIDDLSGDVYLKLVNTVNNVEYLIKATSEASAVPTGFTATVDPCSVAPIA